MPQRPSGYRSQNLRRDPNDASETPKLQTNCFQCNSTLTPSNSCRARATSVKSLSLGVYLLTLRTRGFADLQQHKGFEPSLNLIGLREKCNPYQQQQRRRQKDFKHPYSLRFLGKLTTLAKQFFECNSVWTVVPTAAAAAQCLHPMQCNIHRKGKNCNLEQPLETVMYPFRMEPCAINTRRMPATLADTLMFGGNVNFNVWKRCRK
eukprot:3405936-Amphidinium_carterae.1